MTKTEAGRRAACAPEAAQKEGFFGLIGCRDCDLAAAFFPFIWRRGSSVRRQKNERVFPMLIT